MARDAPPSSSLPSGLLLRPQVRLLGEVSEQMVRDFRDQADAAEDDEVTAVELTTFGGDADLGRRIADDVRLRLEAGRRLVFIGRTVVYSAGVSIMAAFPARDRLLSRDTRLLIHERRQTRDVRLEGPLRVCAEVLHGLLAETRNGMSLEAQGFDQLVAGSRVTREELSRRIAGGWYLSAAEAVELELVAGLV